MDWQRLLPKYWFQNDATDLEWDRLLNGLLDRFEPKFTGYGACTIGGVEVWVENWPYAYGTPYSGSGSIDRAMPRVVTRKRLRRLQLAHHAKLRDEALEPIRDALAEQVSA